ncbi:hydrogenase formation protein HypD [Persicimonas caeni]|uniref:Hydrogenase formation protein HypD n=1 Tax=Persicimonas caeni TaxID=2292766 RepID=A0A4Y6PP04_PERCE|nr:hydrogenase formation protein HypD [Persicimonas caeni]QDG49535.1 hydrogenase formation protein HypD [Persicimonas caeni]QED30756.1 hydrogenase formation protein HypD [Persicimonas caeni]
MKYLDEYRDPKAARTLAKSIARRVTRPWTIMEICGGQTHAIVRFGIDEMLPDEITLVHGPGCPVCVTPVERIDRALELAARPGVILCSFGDMLRVPGSGRDLLSVKAAGGDVRVVYSPLDAVEVAEKHPDAQVVFFAVGFETTAPANAMAVKEAKRRGLDNFSLLVSHVLVPPAMEAILAADDNRVQGFLAAGHVCTVMGTQAYAPIAARHRVPIVVTGFEPLDLLQGIDMCIAQLEEGRSECENQYVRSVREGGNPAAMSVIEDVFEVADRDWRGLGSIPTSGFRLRADYAAFDADAKFAFADEPTEESTECIAGEILRGVKKPRECPAFGKNCTPEHPLGAPMVSTEGACAAYYKFRNL